MTTTVVITNNGPHSVLVGGGPSTFALDVDETRTVVVTGLGVSIKEAGPTPSGDVDASGSG